MKKNEFVQIKGLDLKELKIKEKSLREEIANLVLDKNMKKLKDLKMISKKKKDLARILTVIGQKELLAQLEYKVQKEDSNKTVIASEAKQSSSGNNPTQIASSSFDKLRTPRNDKRKRSKKA